MQRAIRSPLTAGIALVGATAIAIAPLTPTPPSLSIKADQISTVFAEYTPTGLASALADLTAGATLALAQGAQGLGVTGSNALFNFGTAGNALNQTVGTFGNTLSAT